MPLPGGPSDKLGNHFEAYWTVACMVDVMDEKAQAIRIEVPGTEGEKAEFRLTREYTSEYHQVKRQNGSDGKWSLADLASMGVLSAFWHKLHTNDTARCIFVSMDRAPELEELADRARRAISWEEYEQEFLKAKMYTGAFSELCRSWGNCSGTEAYATLQRIYGEGLREDTLRSVILSRLAPLVEGVPSTILADLIELASESIHQILTAHEIWRYLEKHGYRRREWWNDPHWLAVVHTTNGRYLSQLKKTMIAHAEIPRDEVRQIGDILTGSDQKRSVLLTGEAGIGKSHILFQVIQAIQTHGWPWVAFRVDRLQPTTLCDEVGVQLGLPASPAQVLANIARGKECLLVIDQLDAVSQASGRNPEFFECIDEIIDQAEAHPNMHLLLACRKFDLDNDPRLRRLTDPKDGIAVSVEVRRLPRTTVQSILAQLQVAAGQLTDKQLELFSVPLHLWLLASIVPNPTLPLSVLVTVNDLYDYFWEYKQLAIETKLGYPINWAEILDALCDYMSNHQVLSVPKDLLDASSRKLLKAMLSEHVLLFDGKVYAFFHEGFFDYLYARRFVARGQRLLPLLLSSEQHLFRRAQIRQILAYQREQETERARYLADLSDLLTHPHIRFHLKQVTLGWLASLPHPLKEEWDILTSLMRADPSGPLTGTIWQTLYGSASWFLLLDSLGLIQQWLADQDGSLVNRAVWLLTGVQRQVPDQVAERIELYIGNEGWHQRLENVMVWADVSAGRRFFELFLRLLEVGVLDRARGPVAVNSDFWSLLYPLPEKHPSWACEAIALYFLRRLELSLEAGQPNPFDSTSGTIPDSPQLDPSLFSNSAKGAPETFVKLLLPFMLLVMRLTATQESGSLWVDSVWGYRFLGGGYGLAHELLGTMEVALAELARNQPEIFSSIGQQLRSQPFETAQYLLIRSYTAHGKQFANEAIDFLCEQPLRLKLGYRDGDPHWATRQLLEATTPYCSDEALARLERTILGYYPDYEKSHEGRQYRGHAQLTLLEGITPSRRTIAMAKQLAKWQYKFAGREAIKAPRPIRGTADLWVGSPIPQPATEKMTDVQWLRAVAQYDSEMGGYRPDGSVVGGAAQLSRLLEMQVKREPHRFAELVCQFPDTIHPYYFDAVLRGLAETNLDAATALRICQRCHQLPNRPTGRQISSLIATLAQASVPEELCDILIWYATEHPDPGKESWQTPPTKGEIAYGNSIVFHGINSVRGSAALALSHLIFHDPSRITYFLPALEQMTFDVSLGVRSCVIDALTSLLKYDPALAIRFFYQTVDTDDAMLSTQHVERFLFFVARTHFDDVKPVLDRMLKASIPEVVSMGARLVCQTSLEVEAAQPLAHLCVDGTEAQQRGAAMIFSRFVAKAEYRTFCENALKKLFHAPYEKVRSELAVCFDDFQGAEIGTYSGLIQTYIQSPTFDDHSYRLIHALEQTTAKLPEVTCEVCERFLDVAHAAIIDPRTHAAAEADRISQLIIRVYRQSTDEALQARCLDIIDRMAEIGAPRLTQALADYDR